jgi:amino acid transporter
MERLSKGKANLGTAPVFLTAISTILGAIMFLRFGYAVGNVGFLGTLGIILFAHLVTIPTAMAIAEIATNQKVEGGGEYYIISRSFGINIGASIGVALYLSQAISVAFYIIAFAEAFDPIYHWVNETYNLAITDKRWISIPAVIIISLVMIYKGSDLGIKTLWFVVALLFISLIMFFVGDTQFTENLDKFQFNSTVTNPDSFFYVFAIVFPAFTGMTAGVGLSGDLKNPKKSIPLGTLSATIIGMLVYVVIAYKLAASADPGSLANDQLVMSKIAIWGPIIPIGLAAATISSAIGSFLVAPRTLQALAIDRIIPFPIITRWLSFGKGAKGEPFNASIITAVLAIVFVSFGNVDFVAKIISMFFMVTYGAICLISFLQHFAADPSYRPDFRSRWYVSLLGAILTVYLMFSMNGVYAFVSILVMVLIYLAITHLQDNKEGMAKIFQGVIFQLSRRLQVFLQKAEKEDIDNWRPSIICISKSFFQRPSAFNFMTWISHRYGFGTYIHYINGYFSTETNIAAREELKRLIKVAGTTKSNVYLDTMISPSFTSAVAQAIQLPSVSGKDVNMVMFEYSRNDPEYLKDILDNFTLIKSADLDICILGSCDKGFGVHSNIHIWITPNDIANGSLMILMGYVIMGHPDWKRAQIRISAVFPLAEISEVEESLIELIKSGRLPISPNNVELIPQKEDVNMKDIINQKSKDADLVMIGFRKEAIKQLGDTLFEGYDEVGNILFVNTSREKAIY